MGDSMDKAQALNEALVDDALKRTRVMATLRRPGLTECEVLDCREPIAPERTRLGARRCDDCEREAEIRRGQYARGRG